MTELVFLQIVLPIRREITLRAFEQLRLSVTQDVAFQFTFLARLKTAFGAL